MKIFLIIYAVFISGCITAQPNKNILSPQQFESISINGQSLKSIWQTNGDKLAVQNLFGAAQEIKIWDTTPGAISLSFFYSGLRISFSNNLVANGNLSGFEFTNSAPILRVKGVAIRMGDNISKLGSVKINNDTDGGKSIIFAPDNDETVFLYIDFDQSSKKITKIGYFVLT